MHTYPIMYKRINKRMPTVNIFYKTFYCDPKTRKLFIIAGNGAIIYYGQLEMFWVKNVEKFEVVLKVQVRIFSCKERVVSRANKNIIVSWHVECGHTFTFEQFCPFYKSLPCQRIPTKNKTMNIIWITNFALFWYCAYLNFMKQNVALLLQKYIASWFYF